MLNPDAGCNCNRSGLAGDGLKHRLADLFLFGLTMTMLLVSRTRRP